MSHSGNYSVSENGLFGENDGCRHAHARPHMPKLKNWSTASHHGGPSFVLDYPDQLLHCLDSVGSPEYRREDNAGSLRPPSPIRKFIPSAVPLLDGGPQCMTLRPHSQKTAAARTPLTKDSGASPDAEPGVAASHSLQQQLSLIEQHLRRNFQRGAHSSRYPIDSAHFCAVLKLISSHVPPSTVPKLIAAAKANPNGPVEFIPLAMAIIRTDLTHGAALDDKKAAWGQASIWCEKPPLVRTLLVPRPHIELQRLQNMNPPPGPSRRQNNRRFVQSLVNTKIHSRWSVF